MREFDFLAPRSIDEAIAFMSERQDGVHVLAGGTNLLVGMREGTVTPRAVMSLKKLPDLRMIQHSKASGLRIGAMVTLRQIARSPR
jgi:CO/xanthine dehydrogenase FAD-binding subunit